MDPIDLLRQRFINRADILANYVTPQNRPCPVQVSDEASLRSCLAAHLGLVSYSEDHVVGGKVIGRKTINRIGAYCPGLDSRTRWLCVDLDGKGHASALKDPLAMAQLTMQRARSYGLEVHLERSGGGRGWHVWCFFDEPISAKDARALGLGLVPTDAPLIGGGVADPDTHKAIEIFPKIESIRDASALGHMVWLPFWGKAPNGCARFYDDTGVDELFDAKLELTESYTASEAVAKLHTDTEEQPDRTEERATRKKVNATAFDDIKWSDWRAMVYERIDITSIYRLTGKKVGGGWLECRAAEGEDKNPSAAVSDGSAADRGLYHDYRNNETLNVIDYIMKYVRTGDSFLEAARWVADQTGCALPAASPRPGRPEEPPPIESLDELAVSSPELFQSEPDEQKEPERLKVNAGSDERDVVRQIWKAMRSASVFNSGDAAVSVRRGEVKPLGPKSFRAISNECIHWHRWKKVGEAFEEHPSRPNDAALAVAHAAPWMARPLRMVTSAPVYSRTGKLISTPGYDGESRVYYAPKRLIVPEVSDNVTTSDLTKAHTLIFGKMLRDFPFADQRSRAHAVAAFLNPMVRLMIDGPTPLYVYSAPASGTGKSLLAGLVPLLHYGWIKTRSLSGRNEEENKKAIHSYLLSDPGGIIFLDNFRGHLEDPVLEAAITSRRFGGRVLGGNDVADPEVLSTWLLTANNPKVNTDTHRRSVVIRLDSGESRPEFRKRESFAIPNLVRWSHENRGDLLWALSTMVQAWLQGGSVESPSSMGSFEQYASTMGGILQANGVDGFLEKKADDVSDDEIELQQFIEQWFEAFEERAVKSSDLLRRLIDRNPELLASRLARMHNDHGRITAIGTTCGLISGRVFKLRDGRKVAVLKRARAYCLNIQTGQQQFLQ